MRYSKLFGKTVRDKPRNADSESHQLLLRAGFVRPAAGGGFLLLPLGQRVMARIEALVAGELRTAGAAMLGLPAGKQAANSDLSRSLRLRRREAASDYPFADHHESTLAMLGGSLALSYRDLPVCWWPARGGLAARERIPTGACSPLRNFRFIPRTFSADRLTRSAHLTGERWN